MVGCSVPDLQWLCAFSPLVVLFFVGTFFSPLLRARLADVEAYHFTEQAVSDLQA